MAGARMEPSGCTVIQHRYVNRNPGMVGLKHYSEFAGVSVDEQRQQAGQGLAIFKRERVRSECWVAPAHSFDEITVKLLAELGVRTRSATDLSLFPHRDSAQNVVWVPQQLWRFRYVPFGSLDHLHPLVRSDVQRPKHFRDAFGYSESSITTLPEIVAAYSKRRHSVADGVFGELWHLAIRAKRRMIWPARARARNRRVETTA